jgi:hypothetical protein
MIIIIALSHDFISFVTSKGDELHLAAPPIFLVTNKEDCNEPLFNIFLASKGESTETLFHIL